MLHADVLFFKPKTAYEMRISDWSSDVCSSDLFKLRAHHRPATEIGEGIGGIVEQFSAETSHRAGPGQHRPLEFIRAVEHRYPSCSEPAGTGFASSEEGRVGKGSVSTGITRWLPYH